MQPPLLKEKGFRTVGFMDLEEGKSQEGRGDPGGHHTRQEQDRRKCLLIVTDTETGEAHRRGITLATETAKGRSILLM